MVMSKGKRRSDGRETEKDAIELYERAGFEDVYLPPLAKFRNQDVFELFDVLAFHPDRGLYADQIKTNRVDGITAWFERATRFEKALCDLSVGFMVKVEDSGWRRAEPDEDGYTWVCDERDGDGAMGDGVVEYLGGDVDG